MAPGSSAVTPGPIPAIPGPSPATPGPSPAAPRSYQVFTDGASRGNPGHAGVGIVILDDAGDSILECHEYIGHSTNNVAEYRALLLAMERLLALPAAPAVFHLDSELVVRQLNGQYKVKDEKMKQLFEQVRRQLTKLTGAKFVHVTRDK
ncbi:MAG: ribonuclease HI family protein, partial [Candidatus Eisenbacteria bacterium]|nr:ribonuclease HI family protein [Candidatus Eisenbacteria bacterium]